MAEVLDSLRDMFPNASWEDLGVDPGGLPPGFLYPPLYPYDGHTHNSSSSSSSSSFFASSAPGGGPAASGDQGTIKGMLEDFHDTLYTHHKAESIALICLYVPVFAIAFFGNLLVLLVVLPNRHMRNITNCFIVNLAIADLLGQYTQLQTL